MRNIFAVATLVAMTSAFQDFGPITEESMIFSDTSENAAGSNWDH